MKQFLKEPLLHFLLLGAAIFAVYTLVSRPDGERPRGQIVVTSGQIEHLAAGFAKTWRRPPTAAELKNLVDDWIHEEVAAREAMALGLDRDDTVIRRRLRQKLDFVSDDIAAQVEPTDAELNEYLKANPDQFRVEPRISFTQVYLNPARHGDTLARDAAAMLSQLNEATNKADSSSMGDTFLLEHSYTAAPFSELAKQYGEEFAAALKGLAPGRWQGPIESGYGSHLVRITEQNAGRLPELAEVRDTVKRELANARRLNGNRKFYEQLLSRYTVTIEAPAQQAGQQAPAGGR